MATTSKFDELECLMKSKFSADSRRLRKIYFRKIIFVFYFVITCTKGHDCMSQIENILDEDSEFHSRFGMFETVNEKLEKDEF